jgi:phage baseplate assembly protein V
MNGDFGGVCYGIVVDRDDPQRQGCIRVRYTNRVGNLESDWAPIANPMAGKERGFRFGPEIGDECLVAFDREDPDSPIVLGFLHNGVDRPPTTDPKERVIASVNGHRIVFQDPDVRNGNKGALIVEDGHGSSIKLTNGRVFITAKGGLHLDADVLTLNGRLVVRGEGVV